MNIASIINNLFGAASNMVTQFNTEEPLISEETKAILSDEEGHRAILDKIVKVTKKGDVTVSVKGKETTFFVEA